VAVVAITVEAAVVASMAVAAAVTPVVVVTVEAEDAGNVGCSFDGLENGCPLGQPFFLAEDFRSFRTGVKATG